VTSTEDILTDELRGELIAAIDERDELRAEVERLRAALKGVLAEADRKTDAFDRAHAALERPN
jgi:hypothetical protein